MSWMGKRRSAFGGLATSVRLDFPSKEPVRTLRRTTSIAVLRSDASLMEETLGFWNVILVLDTAVPRPDPGIVRSGNRCGNQYYRDPARKRQRTNRRRKIPIKLESSRTPPTRRYLQSGSLVALARSFFLFFSVTWDAGRQAARPAGSVCLVDWVASSRVGRLLEWVPSRIAPSGSQPASQLPVSPDSDFAVCDLR